MNDQAKGTKTTAEDLAIIEVSAVEDKPDYNRLSSVMTKIQEDGNPLGAQALVERYSLQVYYPLLRLNSAEKSDEYNNAINDLVNSVRNEIFPDQTKNNPLTCGLDAFLNPEGALAKKAQELGMEAEWQQFKAEQEQLQQQRQPLFQAAEQSDKDSEHSEKEMKPLYSAYIKASVIGAAGSIAGGVVSSSLTKNKLGNLARFSTVAASTFAAGAITFMAAFKAFVKKPLLDLNTKYISGEVNIDPQAPVYTNILVKLDALIPEEKKSITHFMDAMATKMEHQAASEKQTSINETENTNPLLSANRHVDAKGYADTIAQQRAKSSEASHGL